VLEHVVAVTLEERLVLLAAVEVADRPAERLRRWHVRRKRARPP
jgi:hypothetical protein